MPDSSSLDQYIKRLELERDIAVTAVREIATDTCPQRMLRAQYALVELRKINEIPRHDATT